MFMQEAGDSNIELAIGTLDNPNAIAALTTQDGVESRVAWFNQMQNLPMRNTDQTMPGADWQKLKSLQHPDHDTIVWPPLK